MYINLPTPDQKCSKCGAINQTEVVRRQKRYGKTSVILRCVVCGHEKVTAEESYYPTGTDKDYTVYSTPIRPDVEEF